MNEPNFAESTNAPLSMRIPHDLRERLETLARANSRSLTQEVVKRLRDSVWPSGASAAQRALDALDLPKVMRLRSSSTSGDIDAITSVVDGLGVDRLVFAARQNQLNGATLVIILECGHSTLLMDGTWINMARDPRIGEVSTLMRRMGARGLLRTALYCPQLVDDTTELLPAQAVRQILTQGVPITFDLKAYLDLLSIHGFYEIEQFQPT